jgi:hypothetical protein
MNKTVGVLPIFYSLLLASFSYLAHYLALARSWPTLITGLTGGALCLVLGTQAVAGSRGKALPVSTLTLISEIFILLSQTFMGLSGGREGMQGGRLATAVITLLLVPSPDLMMRLSNLNPIASCFLSEAL